MIKEITKPTSKQTVTAIKSGDFSEVRKTRDAARRNTADVFRAAKVAFSCSFSRVFGFIDIS